MQKPLSSRLGIAFLAAIQDLGWIFQGIVIAYWVSPNTPHPIAREFWFIIGVSVSGNGFIRIYNRFFGDDTAKALDKALEEIQTLKTQQADFQTEIKQQFGKLNDIEKQMPQIITGLHKIDALVSKVDTLNKLPETIKQLDQRTTLPSTRKSKRNGRAAKAHNPKPT